MSLNFCPTCGVEMEKGKCPLRHNPKKDNWHSKAARDKAVMHRLILRLKINEVKEGGRR